MLQMATRFLTATTRNLSYQLLASKSCQATGDADQATSASEHTSLPDRHPG